MEIMTVIRNSGNAKVESRDVLATTRFCWSFGSPSFSSIKISNGSLASYTRDLRAMRPLVQHVSRPATGFLSSIAAVTKTRFWNPQKWTTSPVCVRCQLQALSTQQGIRSIQSASYRNTRSISSQARGFQTSSRCLVESQKKTDEGLPTEEQKIEEKELEQSKAEPIPLQAPSPNLEVRDEALPSSREKQRWDSSKRLSELMEELQEKIAIATQKVNNYTGTDYSGIQALRQDILDQGIFNQEAFLRYKS